MLRVHCQMDFVVTDPEAVLRLAEQRLRAADIDWSNETDTLEEAAAELRTDLALSLASLVEADRLLDGVPGVELHGGRSWVEPSEP